MPRLGRPPEPPLPGTKGLCANCADDFELTKYQRSGIRRGVANLQFCGMACQNAWHRRTFNPSIGRNAREKLRQLNLTGRDPAGYKVLYGRHEHRVIAEQKIGRKLVRGEVVHHVDGNRLNNHPDNLEVMSQSEHCKVHNFGRRKP